MAAVRNGDVAQQHVVTELESDGFVPSRAALAAGESFPGDAPSADDGDVFEILSPDEAVMKVAVAEVLILVPLIGFWDVVTGGVGTGFEHRAAVDLEGDVAAEV